MFFQLNESTTGGFNWKRGKLILFQKPGKEMNCAKSLRPIMLLPVIGKLLEKLFIERIRED